MVDQTEVAACGVSASASRLSTVLESVAPAQYAATATRTPRPSVAQVVGFCVLRRNHQATAWKPTARARAQRKGPDPAGGAVGTGRSSSKWSWSGHSLGQAL